MFLSPLGERLGEGVVARDDYDANWARELRRDGSRAERKVWELLRDRRIGGAKFRRQSPSPNLSPKGGEEHEGEGQEANVVSNSSQLSHSSPQIPSCSSPPWGRG